MSTTPKHACCMSWWIWEMLALPLWGWRHGGCPDEMDLSSGNGTITPNQQLLPKCHTFNQCRKSQFYVTLLLPNTFISHWKFIKQVVNLRKNLQSANKCHLESWRLIDLHKGFEHKKPERLFDDFTDYLLCSKLNSQAQCSHFRAKNYSISSWLFRPS